MTNPLSEQELAACQQQFMEHDEIPTDDKWYEVGFADGIAHLRAELAKEEPVAWRTIGEGGIPMTDWVDGSGTGVVPAWPNCWIQKAYLRPSEPSTSKEKGHG